MKKNRQVVYVFILLLILLSELALIRLFDYKEKQKPQESFNSIEKPLKNEKIDSQTIEENFPKEKDYISSHLYKILEKYPDLKNAILAASTNLTFEKQMVPQGITLTEEHIIITAYDFKKRGNSKCYIYTMDGKMVNVVSLDTKSHVGSIAYDKKNDFVFIPGDNGTVLVYKKDDLLYNNFANSTFYFDLSEKFKIYDNKYTNVVDYLTIDEDDLYVGNFLNNENGLVQKYKIVGENNRLKLILSKEFTVPQKVQGISFYKEGDTKYMILSISFGRKNDSYLEIYNYRDDIIDYTTEKKINLTMPPMLEQNTIYNDRLYIIFESNANKYKNSKNKVDCICILDIKKILSSSNKI